jgi:negative regulator of replication initiation
MRTTITLDDDVAALIESERARTGESFRDVVNRLLRRAARREAAAEAPGLPVFQGRPVIEVSDVSAVLAALDEERRAQRDLP